MNRERESIEFTPEIAKMAAAFFAQRFEKILPSYTANENPYRRAGFAQRDRQDIATFYYHTGISSLPQRILKPELLGDINSGYELYISGPHVSEWNMHPPIVPAFYFDKQGNFAKTVWGFNGEERVEMTFDDFELVDMALNRMEELLSQ